MALDACALGMQGSGRRSSRLTARTARAAEEMRLQETPAAEAAEAAAAADAFGGPPGGCLLDACSSAELALIASQVIMPLDLYVGSSSSRTVYVFWIALGADTTVASRICMQCAAVL